MRHVAQFIVITVTVKDASMPIMVVFHIMSQIVLDNGKSSLSTKEPPLKINGDADFWNYREDDNDYFSQPRALFELMTPEQQQALFDNTARAMGDALDFIKYRHIRNCYACHPAYGEGVAKALGLTVENAQAARETDPARGLPSFI